MGEEDNKNKYAIPTYGQMGGSSELSETELAYLQAAGINPDMLNAMDRASIIRALMADCDLIENPAAGDVAALLFQFGLLQDLLDGEKKKEHEELEEEKKKKKEKERKEREEQMLLAEMQRMQAMEAGQYLAQNPIPDFIFMLPIIDQIVEQPTTDFYQNSQISQATDFAVPFVSALQEALLTPLIEISASQMNGVDLESSIVSLPPLINMNDPNANPIASIDISNINLTHMLGVELNDGELPQKPQKTPDLDEDKPELDTQRVR